MDATVVLSAVVKYQNGSPVNGADVELQEVWQIGHTPGSEQNVTDFISVISGSDTTGGSGSAELRFGVSNLTGNKDHDVRVRVQYGSTVSYVFRWFKISPYTWNFNNKK